MGNNFKKFTLLFLASTLLCACSGANSSNAQSSKQSNSQASSQEPVSSKESTTSEVSSSNVSSSSSEASSSTTNSEPYRPSNVTYENLNYQDTKPTYSMPEDKVTLQSNNTTCANHSLTQESIIKEATIIERGIKRYKCPNCDGFNDEWYYDINECGFENATYAYDGHERTLLLSGMLPLGVSVKYSNNTLTEIGSKEATASLYDSDNHLLKTLTAKLTIVENIGFANFRVTTETGQDPNYKEKEEYTKMTLTVDNCPDAYKKNNLSGGIRVRGNSTNQDQVTKRAWRFKFDSKTNLMGLNGGKKFKSWVIMADYFDQSMFRNASAWLMGKSLFEYSNNHSSDFQHVNLYMNGEYRGIYLLGEQQQCKEGRFNINEPEEGDKSLDVGYLVEIDGLVLQGKSDGDYTFTIGGSGGGMWGGGNSKGYVVKSDLYDQSQGEYIKKYMTNVFTILENAVKTGSSKKLQTLDENHDLIVSPYDNEYDTLNAVIDLDSLFKTYVLQEYMKNYDVGWGSFYIFVDFSKNSVHPRLTFGGPWDFDWSSGNASSGGGGGWGQPAGGSSSGFINQTSGTFINNSQASNSMTFNNPWLADLGKASFFNEMIKKYYTVFAQSEIIQSVYNYTTYETVAFGGEFARNYEKWGTLNGTEVTMYTRSDIVKNYKEHKDAVIFYLNWMKERKDYMDSTYLLK